LITVLLLVSLGLIEVAIGIGGLLAIPGGSGVGGQAISVAVALSLPPAHDASPVPSSAPATIKPFPYRVMNVSR
jgi:hypothetical protein